MLSIITHRGDVGTVHNTTVIPVKKDSSSRDFFIQEITEPYFSSVVRPKGFDRVCAQARYGQNTVEF